MNRVLEIVKALQKGNTVPESTIGALDAICQLYQFNRVRTFLRTKNKEYFIPLDDVRLSKKPILLNSENGIDFNDSFYRKKEQQNHRMLANLLTCEFIHTKEFYRYQEDLESLGYISLEDGNIKEAIIRSIVSDETGIMGFFVFERFDNMPQLTNDEVNELKTLCVIINDRIENFETRKKLKEEQKQNTIDPLTGLPTLKVFKENLEQLMKIDNKYVMIYLDIDKFKYINEIWSHETGNHILQEMAAVISSFIKNNELCCRINDDKYALFLEYHGDINLQERIDDLDTKFRFMQKAMFSQIKITIIGGVYVVQHVQSPNLIIDKANIARRCAKGNYDNAYVTYNQNLESLSERERQIENRSAFALENNEFIPFLQPKFDVDTNEVVGVEALARWKAKDRMISPAEFVPVFEKNGFITKLDFVIFEAVFQFMKKMLDEGCELYPISLNVSRGHISEGGFKERFFELVDKYQIPRQYIELEITESVFMEDKEVLTSFMKELREEGLMISIDDFGTAYSSLNLLKDVEVDVIKMDKSFIDNITSQKEVDEANKDKVVIKNIIKMIQELDFDIIFEGIETDEQIEFLKEIGCKYGQGYVFDRPLPLTVFQNRYLKDKTIH